MYAVISFLGAFVLTVLIECGLASLFKTKRLIYAVFLCNLLTNPLLNFILLIYYNYIGHEFYWLIVAVLEVCVVIGEAFLIRAMMKYTFKKSVALSFLFNACSFTAGLLIGFIITGAIL